MKRGNRPRNHIDRCRVSISTDSWLGADVRSEAAQPSALGERLTDIRWTAPFQLRVGVLLPAQDRSSADKGDAGKTPPISYPDKRLCGAWRIARAWRRGLRRQAPYAGVRPVDDVDVLSTWGRRRLDVTIQEPARPVLARCAST